MLTLKKQEKNIRNRIIEFVKQTTPEKLIVLAVHLNIKVPKELMIKYGGNIRIE